MRNDSECSAHPFCVIREVSVLMEFTSRQLRCHFTDVPPLGHTTTQHNPTHDKTPHGARDTRDTVRRSQRFCSNEAVGSPVSGLQL